MFTSTHEARDVQFVDANWVVYKLRGIVIGKRIDEGEGERIG